MLRCTGTFLLFVFDIPVFSILFLRLSTSKHHFNNVEGCISLLEPRRNQISGHQRRWDQKTFFPNGGRASGVGPIGGALPV